MDASGELELSDADLVEINPMTVDSNEYDALRPLHLRVKSALLIKLRELRAVMRGDDFDRPRVPDQTGEWRAPIGIKSHRTRIRVVAGVVGFAAVVWGVGGIAGLISGARNEKSAPQLVQAARLAPPPRVETPAPAAKIEPPADVTSSPAPSAKANKATKVAAPKKPTKAPASKPATKAPTKKK